MVLTEALNIGCHRHNSPDLVVCARVNLIVCVGVILVELPLVLTCITHQLVTLSISTSDILIGWARATDSTRLYSSTESARRVNEQHRNIDMQLALIPTG
eukprot:9480257-Pyramimonas_sp.AAC.1